MDIVYLNGRFVAAQNATISVWDRGLLFADSVYEIIPIYEGRYIGLTPHLKRLEHSLNTIKMSSPHTHNEWETIFSELLLRNNASHLPLHIYLQITRGTYPVRNIEIPETVRPTVFAFCCPPRSLSSERLLDGLLAITVEDRRRLDCNFKATALLPNVLAHHQAKQANCHEAILIRNGYALEGTSSNLFVVHNNILCTPPLNCHILPGVTRAFILTLAKEQGISHEEIPITVSMLEEASEIWLTGSVKEIYPIIRLNNAPVGGGKVGPIWHQVHALYQDCKKSFNNIQEYL